MAGKNTKNPLLSGAGFNFPFENFNTSALLVPVTQNQSSMLNEEIEADSFLGQVPESSSSSDNFKVLTSYSASVNKSLSSQSLVTSYSEQSLTPNQRITFTSEPQLSAKSCTPIPVFTQSFTGSANPTKPTPIYADSLNHQFNHPVTLQSPVSDRTTQYQPHNYTIPLPTNSSTLLTDRTPSYYTPPEVLPGPLPRDASDPAAPIQSADTSSPGLVSTPYLQTFSYFSSPIQAQSSNTINPSLLENVESFSASTPASVPPQRLPETNVAPPSGGGQNSYRLSNIKRPTYTRPPELTVAPTASMPSPMTPIQTPAALFTPTPVSLKPPEIPTQTPTVLPTSFASLAQGSTYRQPYHHWFFKKVVEGKMLWQPFTMNDSLTLEETFTSATISPDTRVATDGGRYDVEVLRRRRLAVYWQEEPGEVRRCSWFVKGSMDVRYVPYEENVATMLEEEYRIASTSNEWNRHVSLPDGEVIVIHSANAIAHHSRSASPDVWGNSPQMQQKPRVVKRGMDEFDISDGEPERIDHLLFLVHGIGKFCDLKFRPVTEVVDDFRSVSLQLLQSHFKEAVEAGQASRVEVLPVSWHQALHNAQIDTRLNNITLPSIPKLRHFTNDTLLDILFYTSPVFCETIVQAVGNEMNRIYNLFLARNPSFTGDISLGGHSLGSLILFDMLCNQSPASSPSPAASTTPSTPTADLQELSAEEEIKALGCVKTQKARLSRTVSYVTVGSAGTGQPYISYPQLVFRPKAFFALGSPIGMFVTVRGIESLGEEFTLPTCPMFYNIFHPFDPVAYRVESLINPEFSKYAPLLIPHHKGRKRMHLELKDTLEHVGTALKHKLVESVRNTWNTVYQLAMFHSTEHVNAEVNKVIESEIIQSCAVEPHSQAPEPAPDVKMGRLNGGRRVDYVLQEAPLESFNEYLFALSSHVCYWESEDTMLMMLKEIYGTMGVTPDTQVVQQILPFEPPEGGEPQWPRPGTAPLSDHIHVGPPPTAGFVSN